MCFINNNNNVNDMVKFSARRCIFINHGRSLQCPRCVTGFCPRRIFRTEEDTCAFWLLYNITNCCSLVFGNHCDLRGIIYYRKSYCRKIIHIEVVTHHTNLSWITASLVMFYSILIKDDIHKTKPSYSAGI